MSMRRSAGFTLLEVLVALAVVSLTLFALVRSAGEAARSLSHNREATLAALVASNVLAETRIEQRFPPVGTRSGTARMGEREFRWELVVQGTEEPAIRRLDVHVFAGDAGSDDAPLRSISGFAGQR